MALKHIIYNGVPIADNCIAMRMVNLIDETVYYGWVYGSKVNSFILLDIYCGYRSCTLTVNNNTVAIGELAIPYSDPSCIAKIKTAILNSLSLDPA